MSHATDGTKVPRGCGAGRSGGTPPNGTSALQTRTAAAPTVLLGLLAEEDALNLLHRRHVRHPLRRAGGLATLSLLVAALMAWTPAITAGWNQSSAEATLWQLTNGDRVNNGVRPIQQHSTLVSIARWRSKDMIVNNYFSHNIPACGGCLVFHYYDLNGLSYAWAGENIGWNSGYSDPDSAVAVNNQFMGSSEHRSNILNPVWTHGGIGAYGADNVVWQGKMRSPRMYTELFMQAKSAAPPPAPKPTPKPAPRPAPVPAPVPQSAPRATPKAAKKPAPKPAAPKAVARVLSVGGIAKMEAADRWLANAGYQLAREPFEREPLGGSVQLTAYRIDAPAPADRGFFETMLGTLLGFFL